MNKKKINGAPMIPFALLACRIGESELRVTELAAEGFTVRCAGELPPCEEIVLAFYHSGAGTYRRVRLREYTIEAAEETRFFREYLVLTKQEDYRQETGRLFREYQNCISLKMTGDDGYLSRELVGYPWEREEEHFRTFEEQKRVWMREACEGAAGQKFPGGLALAVCLDSAKWREAYLRLDGEEFAAAYREANHLSGHPIAGHPVDRIYVGNQFCSHLFPEAEELFAVLEKARAQGHGVTLMLPAAQERQMQERARLLEMAAEWCEKRGIRMEAAVNDWGTAWLLRDRRSVLEPVLGILLNRRRKDVRSPYKIGLAGREAYPREEYGLGQQGGFQELSETGLNSAFYGTYLRETFGIARYEMEACGYLQKIPEGRHSLHLPFYQTNTSAYCPLYAACHEGSRGRQRPVSACPEYCRTQAFLYPSHLGMAGRYNSLFGYDRDILRSLRILGEYARAGVDRVVIGML